MLATFLEAVMLICFGFSWPLSLIKNIKAHSARNMSLPFILLIIFGYVAGISAKFLNGVFNYVLVIYFLNLFIVSLNVPVYFINKMNDEGKQFNLFRRLHQMVYYDIMWLYDRTHARNSVSRGSSDLKASA